MTWTCFCDIHPNWPDFYSSLNTTLIIYIVFFCCCFFWSVPSEQRQYVILLRILESDLSACSPAAVNLSSQLKAALDAGLDVCMQHKARAKISVRETETSTRHKDGMFLRSYVSVCF